MADVLEDRIQPCLFDRLIDENPESGRDSRMSRVIPMSRYREGVLRDIRWLLNAKAHLAEEAEPFGEVASSVLNYGIADLSGKLGSSLDFAELEHEIREAIKRFEPRIVPNTLVVTAVAGSEHMGPNTVSFEIRGQLWASPLPEQLFLKTQIDLETGECV